MNSLNYIINGKNHGLYVLEESFSNILIERNKKRNGPIFSVKDEYLAKFKNKKFKVFDKSDWTSPENIDLTNIAYTKLNNFLTKKKKISETFNLKTLSWFLATTDLLGTYHAMNLKSTKFYYNPITGLFEIIPFDGHYINPILSHAGQEDRDRLIPEWFAFTMTEDTVGAVDFAVFLGEAIYEDEEFAKEYYAALKKISSKEFLKNFLDLRKKRIKKINSIIYADFFLNDFITYYGPGIYYFDTDSIYKRAKMIRNKIKTNKFKVFSFFNNQNLNIENDNLYNPYLFLTKINCLGKNILFDNQIILKKI